MGALHYLILLFTIFAPWVNGQLQVSVVAPNTFRIGAEESVGIAITNSPGVPRNFEVTLKDRSTKNNIISTRKITVHEGKPQIINMRLHSKDIPKEQVNNDHIFVTLIVKESTNQFQKEVVIPVTKYSGYVFVQTDKPLYLPNQKVFIRIFYLDEKLIPLSEDVTLEIKNPNGTRVFYKENLLTAPSGITESNFKFPSSPVFGNWTVSVHYGFNKVARTTVRFEVKNYVLPTFSVKIKSPKIILKTDENIKGTVTAEYVYGKPVEGTVNFKFAIKKPSGATYPLISYKHIKLDKGESSFSIRKKDITQKGIAWFPSIDKSLLIIEAEVMEKATGKMEKTVDDSSVFTNSPYTIDLSRSLKEFKPGVPYQVQVDIRYVNNLPLETKIPVKVSGIAQNERNANIPLPKKDFLQTDKYGRVMFQFDTEQSFKELTLKVETNDEGAGDNQASASIKVIRYQTPVANTYIWIAAPQEGTLFQVGKTFQTQVTVYPQENNMKLLYMVVSRGMILVLNETQTQGAAVVRTIQFTVTADMSPSFRLIAYFVKNGKIISDSMQFDVEKSCKYNNGNEFSVIPTEPTGLYSPSQDVTFKIKGEPDSMVGIGAVDEALYLLNKRDLLTKEKVFKEMERHDIGNGPGGGINPANVFKNAGILMLSNSVIDEHGRKEGIKQPDSRKKRAVSTNAGVNQEKYLTPEEKANQYTGSEELCCKFGQLEGRKGMDCSTRAALIHEHIGEKYNCSYAFLDCCQELVKYKAAHQRLTKILDEKENQGTFEDLLEMIEADVLKNIRRFFPETWFFDTFKIGENQNCKGERGECELKRTSPHSITTWIVQAIGVSKSNGMCVAEPAKITVFKKMFVQLDLPATAVRGEQIEVLATVFNYENKDLNVNVYMFGTEGVCMGAGPGERTENRKILVPKNSAVSVTFPVMPLEVAEYRLRVAALSWTSSDAVEKVLRVVHEGIPVIKPVSFTLDPSGVYSRRKRRDAKQDGTIKEMYDDVLNKQLITVDLDLPKNYIPGTEKCFINVVGDPVGQAVNTTLSGLEGKFLRIPTGCGEQTMIAMAPLVYTMLYLKKTNQLTGAVEKSGYQYMWQGYSHQQQYRKADGSYAVWASYQSSTWLTAFVVKVFCQASEFIEIPRENINSAIEWLVKRQQATGAFAENYKVHHREMTGGVQGDVTLTAYVLISMLECSKYDSAAKRIAVGRAVSYLEQNIPFVRRPYTVAILAYALSLTNSNKRMDANKKLKDIAHFNPDTYVRYWNWDASEFGAGPKPWVYQHKPGAVAVETTSYALLAQLVHDDLDYAHPIVNWLNQQRTASGSFVSTQDTVIALQALAEYNSRSKVPALDMECNISSSASAASKTTIRLRRDSPHSVKEIKVPAKGRVYFDVTGKGMGTMALTMQYNVEQDPDKKCEYDLSVTAEETDEILREIPAIRPEFKEQDIFPQVLVRAIYDEKIQQEKFGYGDINQEIYQEVNRGGKDLPKEGSFHVMKLTICVKNLEKEHSGMALLDIGLFTGYSAWKEDLAALTNDAKLKVGQFEVSDRSVVLYLDEIPRDRPVCLSFRTIRHIFVGKVQPASVKVYSYYDPDKSCTTFYGPDKSSPMMKKICEGRQCVCVEGVCPSCFPFINLRKIDNDQTRRTELLNIICNRDHDFFWNGTLTAIREDGNFKYFDYSVTDVLNEGVQKRNELEGEKVTFIGKKACDCPKMTVGEVYMIMSKDGFLYKTEDGDMKFKYLFDKSSSIYHSRSLKDIRDPQGQQLQKTFNTLYMRFKRGERCIH